MCFRTWTCTKTTFIGLATRKTKKLLIEEINILKITLLPIQLYFEKDQVDLLIDIMSLHLRHNKWHWNEIEEDFMEIFSYRISDSPSIWRLKLPVAGSRIVFNHVDNFFLWNLILIFRRKKQTFNLPINNLIRFFLS